MVELEGEGLIDEDADGVVGRDHQAVAGVPGLDLGHGLLVRRIGVHRDGHAALFLERLEDGDVDVFRPVVEVEAVAELCWVAAAPRTGFGGLSGAAGAGGGAAEGGRGRECGRDREPLAS